MTNLKLTELTVLAIDCQATHSNPQIGHLAEIGWVNTQAAHPFDHEMVTEHVKTHLVKFRKRTQIPKQFLRITGIEPEEMKGAVSKKIIWQKLHHLAKKVLSENQGICPAVIHFSRYEKPYLEQLHQEFASKQEFPFTIVCTHQIVSRLYPGLPRKSLRAVAGFFGYSLPNLRRSLHHVVATAFIWNHVVKVLEEQEEITTFEELQYWLHTQPTSTPTTKRTRDYPMDKALREDIPDKPGIYRMYRSTGDLLYIGKAKSLKNRVNSYFHKKGRHAEHILEMLSQAKQISTTITKTALEAAVRESDEIKLLSPPYNRALQPNERQLLFYSKDLSTKQATPDTLHPVGPFPANIKMESLAKLIDVLNGKIKKFSPRLIEAVLLTPPEYTPDKDCFKIGLEAFKSEFSNHIETPIHLGHIKKWGTQLWKEMLAERELMAASQEDEEQEQREEGWTPERVSKALKRVIRMGTFQMRRARWFCRLSESNLTWSTANDKASDKHVLIFEKGIASFRSHHRKPDLGDFPQTHKRTAAERQANFDIAIYDCMRIVTTEMRRIIREGRDIELFFHPGKKLNKEQLDKILKWV